MQTHWKASGFLQYIFMPPKHHFYKKNKYILLAFIIPFIIFTIVFAIKKITPFGNKHALIVDLYHQYYPFLVDFQDKLRNGESLLWSWTQGGGTNYLALMSYYLINPFNLLSVFIPAEFLREYLLFTIIARISLAGMFMSILVRYIYKKNDLSIVLFGDAFSFCAFFIGYYWNTIWLDSVILTPILIIGAIKLLKDNDFRLYVVTLSLSILFNYYIGFFSCIFMIILFICYSVISSEGKQYFFKNLYKMTVYSLIAIGITAIITIPSFAALQNTFATELGFPTNFETNIVNRNDFGGVIEASLLTLSNLISFCESGDYDFNALPKIACGILTLIFVIVYFTSKNVQKKEKLVSLSLISFFILSFVIRQLDYIWHGFHFPNMLPYRFSYLLSIILILIAYRAYMETEAGEKCHFHLIFFIMSTLSGIALCYTENHYATTGAMAVAILMCILISFKEIKRFSPFISLLLLIIVMCEGGISAYIGFENIATSAENYPEQKEDAEEILKIMNNLETDTSELWRAEMSNYQLYNDSSLNKYNGLSVFNSLTNVNMTRFCENLGLSGWQAGNRYTYTENSPVLNTFMNLKYLIDRYEFIRNTYDLKKIKSKGNVHLYENEHYLPMGFMVKENLNQWEINNEENLFDPFYTQSEFFRLATGVEEPLYTPAVVTTEKTETLDPLPVTFPVNIKYDVDESENEKKDTTADNESEDKYTCKWDCEIPESGLYFVCAPIESHKDICFSVEKRTSYDEEYYDSKCIEKDSISCIGYAEKGDILSISTDLLPGDSETVSIYVNRFNTEVFEKGYEKICHNVMTTTELSENKMKGVINVDETGLFYTSVPYEKGWTAKVNGKDVKITPVGNAVIAFPLEKGYHEIILEYCPYGFKLGKIISLLSISAFCGAFIFFYHKKTKKSEFSS